MHKIFTIQHKGKDFEISTKYRQAGDELVMFIHGLGCIKDNFDGVWNFPELNDFSIIIFDLIGNGASSKPLDFSYTMEEQADICRKLLLHLKYSKIHIVAHSMGGAIGLLLAEKISNNLISFINVEGNLIASDCSISRKTVSVSYEEFQQRLFARLRSLAGESTDVGARLWAVWSETSDPLGFYKSSNSLIKWSDSGDLLRRFIQLECCKKYLYGEENSHLEVLDMLDGIDKTCISKSGHFPMNDNPAEFYSRIAEMIRGCQ